jgi:hypothetical protein
MLEFIVLTLVSIVVVIGIIRFSLRARKPNPMSAWSNILLVTVAEIICMLLGRYGAQWGFPVWVYYPLPMLITVLFPILYFRMRPKEAVTYLILALVSAPVIHAVFSLAGWKHFMPFLKIPSIPELIR